MTNRRGVADGLTAGTLALVGARAGGGAGQQAQTSNQVPATGGAGGGAGTIQLRDVQFVYDGPVPDAEVYRIGDDARLQLTVINNSTTLVDDGFAADRLVAVDSPLAAYGPIGGDPRLPDGQTLTAGDPPPQPVASIVLPGTSSVEVSLIGLTEPVRAGLTYPVVFTFERAGDVRLEVPVENPQVLPPRAGG